MSEGLWTSSDVREAVWVVWGTPDDGATWSLQARSMRAAFMPPERPHNPNIQDPHAIVRRAAAPGVPCCQRHCGIWRSTDDAASGQVVVGAMPASNFGFAVAVHPVGQDTAWFATAQVDEKRVPVDSAMVVNRTRDGG